MKLLERAGERMVFRLSAREKQLLLRLLSFYPLQSESLAKLSKSADARFDDANELLVSARKEQRSELSGWLARRLSEGAALVTAGTGWRLVLDGADAERLLQVLNEIRVGAWLKLGSPDNLDAVESDDAAVALAPLHGLMMLTGQFEMVLVHAMMGETGTRSTDEA
jgi:hypothetical protein